ncbi:MAG: META domain-containing protein [Bryobacteraceae bacterium]|nr:META domain-containing protein [Bryobacteraceae bacterium]
MVHKFLSAGPGRDCAPVLQSRPAFLDFDSGQNRLCGSGGCNRFSGSFAQKGTVLTFGLEATAGYRMEAGLLILLDASGTPLPACARTRGRSSLASWPRVRISWTEESES